MDDSTILTYNREAELIAKVHDNLIPERLYQLVCEYFKLGEYTLDIGCGIGRDTAWLAANHFQVIGVDASLGMLDQARKRHPELSFHEISLPELAGLADASFTNVLCSAVFMHLEYRFLPIAAKNILRVLKSGGILLISYRGTREYNKRENGKLYESITKEQTIGMFEQGGGEMLFYESTVESGRNHVWQTFIFRKVLDPEL